MADAETLEQTKAARLQVANARPDDSGHGLARLPRGAMQTLGVVEGEGRRVGVAVVFVDFLAGGWVAFLERGQQRLGLAAEIVEIGMFAQGARGRPFVHE